MLLFDYNMMDFWYFGKEKWKYWYYWYLGFLMRKYVFFGMIVKISICVFFIKLNFGLLVYSY